MGDRGSLRRRADGTFGWNLAKNERDVLTHVAKDFRALLAAETPSSDPSLQRLFPPARIDDPIEELEYERKVGDSLLAAKLEQLTILERCVRSRVLCEDDLLATLLGRAIALLPTEAAEAMAEDVGEQYGRALAAQMSPGEGQRSRQAAINAVADALTAHGFAAHAEARGSSLAIINEHCPFGGAAMNNPVICAVDRGMVRGMLAGLYGETVPATESSRAHGDDACVTVV